MSDLKKKIHGFIYPKLGTDTMIKNLYFIIFWKHDILPFYWRIPFTKHKLAIWNCGMQPQTKLQAIKDTRITIRHTESDNIKYILKRGDI